MRNTLKNARRASGLRLRDVAEITGITLRHYQRIEAGTRAGSYELWQTLEAFFGIPRDVLRNDTEIIPNAAKKDD